MQTMNEPWTPGPWRIEQPHHDRAYVMSEHDRTLAVADGQNFEADARLIAAAPEMAAYLRLLSNHMVPLDGPGSTGTYGLEVDGDLARDIDALLSRIRGA